MGFLYRTLAALNGKSGMDLLMYTESELQQIVAPSDLTKLKNRLLLVKNTTNVFFPFLTILNNTFDYTDFWSWEIRTVMYFGFKFYFLTLKIILHCNEICFTKERNLNFAP